MNNTRRTSKKDSISSILLASVLLLAGFYLAYQFVEPAPPSSLSISTGSKEGAYYAHALKYQTWLAKQGIELTIKTSAGSADNLTRLLNDEVDLALVQGGLTQPDTALLSLGSLYYEPAWLFYRQGLNIQQLNQLSGKKIAIGPSGSGTRSLAKILLSDNGLDENQAQLLDDTGSIAADKLLKADIDAAFFIGSEQSRVIQQLLHEPTITLLSLSRAEAYQRLHPFLSSVSLPAGVISLQKNLPASDIQLLAPSANLLTSDKLHPALAVLVLQAIKDSHQAAGIFAQQGQFPNAAQLTAPISDIAERFYQNGPPFLMRYLPFSTAIMIDRFIVMLIPLIALLIPLVKVMPPLYRWRISSRIYRWYEALHAVDDKIHQQQLSQAQRIQLEQQLSHIENEVNKVKTPLSYADKVYQLLLHIDLIRRKLQQK
ncbi:MAG: TAXI family TRAP transporter solute-binding subunit [Cycloclasticus sp.]